MKPIESQLEAVLAQVFERLPGLVGFSVEIDPELSLPEVDTFPWTLRSPELMGEIAVPLLELMDEQPEARALLHGRTFVRTLH
jgi:hypothetical protein